MSRLEDTARLRANVGERLRRLGATRLVAIALLAAALGSGVSHLPVRLWRLHVEIKGLAAATPVERELRAIRYAGYDADVLVAAERLLPEDATYYVTARVPGTFDVVATFAAYWLLPRQQTRDPGDAEWVLSYRGKLDALGLDYARIVEVDPGITLAEVRR